MKKLFTLLAIVIGLQFSQTATAQFQYGLNPNDPNVVFGANDRPALPAWNDYGIVKWGHRNRSPGLEPIQLRLQILFVPRYGVSFEIPKDVCPRS
jgi:hypothetical protein